MAPGRLEVVAGMIRDNPAVARARGPHRIPLLKHAEAGGSREMVELLRRHGAV